MASDKALELSQALVNLSSTAGYSFVKQAANKIVDTSINCVLVIIIFSSKLFETFYIKTFYNLKDH